MDSGRRVLVAGEMLVGTLEDEGLPNEFVERDPAARTALAFANAVTAVTTIAPGTMTALPAREAARSFRTDLDRDPREG
ncbi:MAG: hypothetical protein V5A62_05170 [Haloarculaceae archaeon]